MSQNILNTTRYLFKISNIPTLIFVNVSLYIDIYIYVYICVCIQGEKSIA